MSNVVEKIYFHLLESPCLCDVPRQVVKSDDAHSVLAYLLPCAAVGCGIVEDASCP